MKETPILLTRQIHHAKRSGKHYDLRIVIGDKAFSWATKKEMPTPGKPILLFEQPTHTASYALSKHIVIPDGQYGAGETFLDFAQKGKAQIHDDAYHLDLNNGDRYLIKKMPEHYGDKAWLFLKKKDVEVSNKYLNKVAERVNYEVPVAAAGAATIAGSIVGGSVATSRAVKKAINRPGPKTVARAREKALKDPAMANVRDSIMNKQSRNFSKLSKGISRIRAASRLGVATGAAAMVAAPYLPTREKKASLYDDMVNHRAALRSEAHQMYPDHWQGEAPRSLWNKAHEMVKEDTTVDDEGNADVPDINPYLARLMRNRHVSAGIEETYGNSVVDHADNLAHNNAGIKSFGAALAGGAVGAASGLALGKYLHNDKLGVVAGGVGAAIGAIGSAAHVYGGAKEKGLVSANAYLENKYNPYADKAKNFI